MPSEKTEVMDQMKVRRALMRIAHEIIERNSGAENLAIIGIKTRGDYLADRVAENIKKIENADVPVGYMDITFYRDDVHTRFDQPEVHKTEVLFPIDDKVVVLVDDVLFTGRTIRAALDQVIDFGRPKAIQLAVLVDRGHRELPIKADYVGKNIPTSPGDDVEVHVTPIHNEDSVHLVKDSEVQTRSSRTESGKRGK